ncbi:FG-GAP repeat domain-containing protein, partial [Stenotrophomonas maltophilia]|uniref:FG-GAP repeat domain-containing protein n=1 Tax=Stenotrophomonas maltophilia TaxID=40324 RepID=UPI001140EE16
SFTDALQRTVGTGMFGAGVNVFLGSDYSIAAADFNGDGFLDVIGNGSVYLNNGKGSFSLSGTYLHSSSVTTGDFNGDGKVDIAAAGNISLGNGNGTFRTATSYTALSSGSFIFAGDINNDGLSDAVSLDAV